MSFDMLVEGFTECKIRVPSFEGPIKGVMGWLGYRYSGEGKIAGRGRRKSRAFSLQRQHRGAKLRPNPLGARAGAGCGLQVQNLYAIRTTG